MAKRNLWVLIVSTLLIGGAFWMLSNIPAEKDMIPVKTTVSPEAREFLADPGAGLAPTEMRKEKEEKVSVGYTDVRMHLSVSIE